MKLLCEKYSLYHELILIPRSNEIVIATPDGKEIGSLTVETMETDIKVDGAWKTVPTKNFFVVFNTGLADTDRNVASVIIDPIPTN